MTEILLVCTGNICRSPMAEAVMRQELQQRNENEVGVTSAGTGAWDGALASEGAYLVALEHGLDLSNHRARLLTRELVEQSDLILTMARHHRVRVEELGGTGKTHLLGEYAGVTGADAEVSDPFGSDLPVYRQTFEEIQELIHAAVERFVDSTSGKDSR
jgi:protein-tyrosine-phosphatase